MGEKNYKYTYIYIHLGKTDLNDLDIDGVNI
jgi:hypothetical protein